LGGMIISSFEKFISINISFAFASFSDKMIDHGISS
jgi:hypothetical protein